MVIDNIFHNNWYDLFWLKQNHFYLNLPLKFTIKNTTNELFLFKFLNSQAFDQVLDTRMWHVISKLRLDLEKMDAPVCNLISPALSKCQSSNARHNTLHYSL